MPLQDVNHVDTEDINDDQEMINKNNDGMLVDTAQHDNNLPSMPMGLAIGSLYCRLCQESNQGEVSAKRAKV